MRSVALRVGFAANENHSLKGARTEGGQYDIFQVPPVGSAGHSLIQNPLTKSSTNPGRNPILETQSGIDVHG